jgi:hypothetical protein
MVRSRIKKSPAKKSFPGCKALIRVDGTAIRKKISREYENARREVETVRTQMRRFDEIDKPAFSRWLHRELGGTLSLCRELEHKIRLQETILFQVQETSFFSGISPKKAYERVMREQEKAEREAAEDEHEPNSGQEHRNEEQRHHQQDRQRDFFERDETDDFPFSRGKPSKPQPETFARLKDLYRLVVRKLHPDLQKEMSAQKAEWWHQAQAAYQKQDAEQLEIILCFCEIDEQQSTRNTSLSILQRITRALKSSLRPLRRELKERQSDLAWNFSKKQAPELIALARNLKADFESDLQALKAELAEIEEELAELKSQRGRARRRAIDPFEMIFGQL